MDNGTQYALTLKRLSDGGFVVQDAYVANSQMMTSQHFACTTIDEALRFMRDKISPISAQSPQVNATENDNG